MKHSQPEFLAPGFKVEDIVENFPGKIRVWMGLTDGLDPAQYLQLAKISGSRKSIQVDGFSGLEISSAEEAGLSFVNEDEVWVVIVRGVKAPSLLHEIASNMQLAR